MTNVNLDSLRWRLSTNLGHFNGNYHFTRTSYGSDPVSILLDKHPRAEAPQGWSKAARGLTLTDPKPGLLIYYGEC